MADRRASHDFSIPCVKHFHVKREAERTTVHQTHDGRTFSPVRGQDASHLLLLALLFFLSMQFVSAGSHEYGCKAGQTHKRFTGCECGYYALIIPSEEVEDWQDAGVTVHTLNRGRKPKYYTCAQCSKCGDGVLVTSECTQLSDTECSPDRCADPTWVFDFGLKACKRASPARAPTTTKRAPTTTSSWPLAHGETPSERAGVHDKHVNTPFGTKSWLEKHITDIITAVVVGLALVVVCIFAMLAMMVWICRRVAAPKSPYSSHYTSKSSVADV